MKVLFSLILVLYITVSEAQDSTLVTIKAGSTIRDGLSAGHVFLYPQYQAGLVVFRDGTKAKARMNYHSLYDQVLFIDPKGDTLAITDEKTLQYIAVHTDTLYYANGYLRQVASTPLVVLAEKKTWEVADIRKIGSHDRQAITYAVTTLRTVTDGFGRTRELVLNEDVILRKTPQYFFGDRYFRFVPADKKNLLSLFSKQQPLLTSYLKEHPVNFHKKEDLLRLLQFLVEHAQ